MRARLLVTGLAALCGSAAIVAWPNGGEGPYESAPAITMDEPLPDGSAVVEVTVDMDTVRVGAGAVIEATYAGRAAEGHAPCATLQYRRDGEWIATHVLGSAGTLSAGTNDFRVDQDEDGRVWVENDGERFVVVCPAMAMTGAGPERFRLPLDLPTGQARICPDLTWDICIPLEITSWGELRRIGS